MCRRRWPTFQLCHRMVHDAVAIPLNEVPGVMIVNPPAHRTSQFRQECGVHGAKLCHKVLWLGRCCSRSDSPERERSSFGSRPEAQTGRTASGVPLGDTGTYAFRVNSSTAGRLEDARVPLADDGTRTIRVSFSKTCVMTPETRRNKQRHVSGKTVQEKHHHCALTTVSASSRRTSCTVQSERKESQGGRTISSWRHSHQESEDERSCWDGQERRKEMYRCAKRPLCRWTAASRKTRDRTRAARGGENCAQDHFS